MAEEINRLMQARADWKTSHRVRVVMTMDVYTSQHRDLKGIMWIMVVE